MSQTATTVLHFKGHLTFERIGILLNELKNKKDYYGIQPVLYKKLLALMIEMLENIFRYSDQYEEFISLYPSYLPEFELNRNHEGFSLKAKNPVRDKDVDEIRSRIEKINSANEEELKKTYRETITNGMFTEKGGAGLGFIEMAKITEQGLDYAFARAEPGFSMFELNLYIRHTDNKVYG